MTDYKFQNNKNMNVPIASHTIRFPGYGLFWVANSISSTLLGMANRKLKDKASQQNEEFQIEMRKAQEITEDKRLQEEYAFKRRLLDLSRQYRNEQTVIQFNNQLQSIELRYFLQYNWPLAPQLPDIFLEEIRSGQIKLHPNLNVILMHAPLLPMRFGITNDADAELYVNMEDEIVNKDANVIGNIEYHASAAYKDSDRCIADVSGGNSNIMNIHFLMSQIPTLVISPYYTNDGLMHFNGAVWESQSPRPLIRSLFSFNYDIYEMSRSEEYRVLMMNKFHAAVTVITGSVRDSYMMLTQGKAPTMSHWLNSPEHSEMKKIVSEDAGIRRFIHKENDNIIAALNEQNSPQLLEAYSQADINNMMEEVKSINL